MFAAPVEAQNCQTFYNPVLPMPVSDDYECYQRFVWYNQGKGSWCAKDWYRSCLHSGLRNSDGTRWSGDNTPVFNPNEPDSGNNLLTSIGNGWIFGYTHKDKGKVSQHWFYVDNGVIIGFPYVCGGSLKTTPDDPGQQITSTDLTARTFFENLTLAEIQTYKTSGSCGGCPAAGNNDGTGCN